MCRHPCAGEALRRTRPGGSDIVDMTDYERVQAQAGPQPESGWAISGIVFAACMLTIIGAFEAIAGLTAIIDDTFYVVARNYTFDLDVSTWGWIHLILGALLILT